MSIEPTGSIQMENPLYRQFHEICVKLQIDRNIGNC